VTVVDVAAGSLAMAAWVVDCLVAVGVAEGAAGVVLVEDRMVAAVRAMVVAVLVDEMVVRAAS